MTTPRRRTSRAPRARRSSTPTAWWNEQSVENSLPVGGSARFSLVNPLTSTGLPATWEAGLTVIRLIVEVTHRALLANLPYQGAYGVMVNTIRQTVDVILDLFDYYLHKNFIGISPTANNNNTREQYDIRTARRVRGSERSLDFVITNNAASATTMVWSVSARMLLRA